VIDLVRLARPQDVFERSLIQKVPAVEREPLTNGPEPRDLLRGGSANQAVDLVSLVEKQFSEVAAVLPADPGDERTHGGQRTERPDAEKRGSGLARRGARV
jgi:hypothetical protein